MYLRGDQKIGRLERGDFSLRAKGHFKGGPESLDETMRFEFPAFWEEKVLQDTVKLKEIASVVVRLIERMAEVQNIG